MKKDDAPCLGPIPLLAIIENIKYLIYFYLILIKPLKEAIPDHLHLSPLLVLEGELDFILKDENCFVPFYKFVEYKEENESKRTDTISSAQFYQKKSIYRNPLNSYSCC